MSIFNEYWKITESHWTSARYSYTGSTACDIMHSYSSKKKAIERMKEILHDWLEWENNRASTVVEVLFETEDHVTAMSYDPKLDAMRLVDIILEKTTIY